MSNPDLLPIDEAAERYRRSRDVLRQLAADAQRELQRVKEAHLPLLRQALADVAIADAALRGAVERSPTTLWARVRTRVVHGVKVGWAKAHGKVDWDDETKVIERIRKLLPAAQADLLIRTRESVHKPAVYDLTAGDLKRLGIRIADDCDQVVVKDTTGDLDRAIEALLAERQSADQEAEAA
jgi:hypothetical protein